jgi:mRNA interferase MazF
VGFTSETFRLRARLSTARSDHLRGQFEYTVVAAVITSNLRLAAAPGNVQIPVRGTGLSTPSVVNVSQIITVDRTFVTERLGRLNSELLRQVEEGLRLVLSL